MNVNRKFNNFKVFVIKDSKRNYFELNLKNSEKKKTVKNLYTKNVKVHNKCKGQH